MATSLKNGGLISVYSQAGHAVGAMVTFPIANSYATNIFKGDLVKLGTDGTIQKVTVSTDYPIGVFAGLKPEGQGRNPASYFVAGTSASSGKTIKGLVITDPMSLFEIQADGSVSQGDVGANFDVVVGTGVATYGQSNSRLSAASRSDAALGLVKILDISTRADNLVTDAYPYVIVQLLNKQNLTKVSVA